MWPHHRRPKYPRKSANQIFRRRAQSPMFSRQAKNIDPRQTRRMLEEAACRSSAQ